MVLSNALWVIFTVILKLLGSSSSEEPLTDVFVDLATSVVLVSV